MSRIINSTFRAGDSVSSSDMNDKFSDITTETTAKLDGENFRSESVDLPNINKADMNIITVSAPEVILMGCDEYWNNIQPSDPSSTHTATTTNLDEYDSSSELDGPLALGIAPKPYFDIANTDLLRVYWQVWVTGVDATNTISSMSVGDSPCWVVWLEWNIVSDALLSADFVAVPGQGEWRDGIASDSGNNTDETSATSIIPHVSRVRRIHPTDPAQSVADDATYMHFMVRDSWMWKNTLGSTQRVYGLRLKIHGLYHPSNRAGVNYIVHDNSAYSTAWSGDTIDIGSTRITALHMRTK